MVNEPKRKLKNYYWLKFKEDFFQEREIKKLRKLDMYGDTYTIIYLRIMLLSIENGGLLIFKGFEETIEEQIQLELDEDLTHIKTVLEFMKKNDLIEEINKEEYMVSKVPPIIGKESDAAERMRKMRERKNSNSIEKENEENLETNNETQNDNKTKETENKPIIVEPNQLSMLEDINEQSLEKMKQDTVYKRIYEHWNSKKIIVHQKLTQEIEFVIKEKLKLYSFDEIIEYINNYSKVIEDSTYFYKYKWTLVEFLKRKDGISSFKNDGSKWVNYLENLKKNIENQNKNNNYYNKTTKNKKETILSDEELNAFGGN